MAGSIKVLLTISRSHGLPSESWPEPTIFWPEVARAVTPEELAESEIRVETKPAPSNLLPLVTSKTYSRELAVQSLAPAVLVVKATAP